MIYLGVLLLFEIWLWRHKKTVWSVIVILAAPAAWLIMKWPILLPAVFCAAHFANHRHFLWEEKGYALLLLLLFGMLIYLTIHDTILLQALTSLAFVIMEYIQLRILKREEDKTVIYQNELLKKQVDETEALYTTMRGWRHDYHNHLQSLKSYLHLNQFDQMENYLNDLEKDLDSIDRTYKSGNLQLDAILNAKLAIAKNKEIAIKCDAVMPKEVAVSDIDLCVILGNLLDNAIESCCKLSNTEDRFLRIYIARMKGQLYLSVMNATNEAVRIRTDEYFTNKRGDHGHGLRRVDQTVKKYNGYINRQNEPGVFATEILLPL